jgi:hypothetical protein
MALPRPKSIPDNAGEPHGVPLDGIASRRLPTAFRRIAEVPRHSILGEHWRTLRSVLSPGWNEHREGKGCDVSAAGGNSATISEIEEHLLTIDEQGNRRTLICIRTFEAVYRSVGPLEVERHRRYTLPGYGHVTPLSATEFEVFHGRFKLRLVPTPPAPRG